MELVLTPKDESKREWPQDLPATVDCLAAAFDQFAEELAGAPALCAAPSAAAKVKAVADAVWSKLQKGSYSKDLQHAQVGVVDAGGRQGPRRGTLAQPSEQPRPAPSFPCSTCTALRQRCCRVGCRA